MGSKRAPDVKSQIAGEIYAAMERLGAEPELLAIVGSWRDTMSDEEVIGGAPCPSCCNLGATPFFFFAGHGLAADGINYMLPADVPEVEKGQVTRLTGAALREEDITAALMRVGARVVVLDACRDNPFGSGTRGVGGERASRPMSRVAESSRSIPRAAGRRRSTGCPPMAPIQTRCSPASSCRP